MINLKLIVLPLLLLLLLFEQHIGGKVINFIGNAAYRNGTVIVPHLSISATNPGKSSFDFLSGNVNSNGADSLTPVAETIVTTSGGTALPQTGESLMPRYSIQKVDPKIWIKGRESKDKMNLISWLIHGCLINKTADINVNLPACHLDAIRKDKANRHPPEFQTFDGFYNNIFKVDLGGVDTPLLRRVPPVYSDSVYQPVKGKRQNPFKISDAVMTRIPNCTREGKTVACGSKTGKTAFLVYFGQQVVEELLDAQRPGCPPEYFNIEIPEDHKFRTLNISGKIVPGKPGKKEMPFLRSRYDQSTGHSPSNPRQQLNEITPWIDGGLIYGTSKAWADVLRTNKDGQIVEGGLLASENDEGLFPILNNIRLPLANPPPPAFHGEFIEKHETRPVSRFFVLGNPRGNENAFLLSFGVVLFRWHNQIATYLHSTYPNWSGERVFQEARKWAIATYQQIVMYDWLKEWLGEALDNYKGYDSSVDPQIEQFFQTAAMRFGHTLVTPGAYMRDYACGGCMPINFYGTEQPKNFTEFHKNHPTFDPKAKGSVRTCNIFWRPQEPLLMPFEESKCPETEIPSKVADIDRLLMGMASQRCEREDNMIVEDLRGNVFGTLEFSRRDLMAVNIQRGRDHGTPDYNTAREALGLQRIENITAYLKLTNTATPVDVLQKLEDVHKNKLDKCENCLRYENHCSHNHDLENERWCIKLREMCSKITEEECLRQASWNNIDVWTGGILETSDRPGPLFRAIIKDQFTRIRNADRFWFENTKWKFPRFTTVQIERIKTLRVYDMIMSVTRMKEEDIQKNPFRVPTEEDTGTDFWKKCGTTSEAPWQESTCTKQEYGINGEKIGQEKLSKCYHFPQLDSLETPVEKCTDPGTYDYFHGSEISYCLTFTTLGLIILGIAALVPMLASTRQKRKQQELVKLDKQLRRSFKISGHKSTPFAAREWQSHKDGTRAVAIILNEKYILKIHSHKGELLRSVDLSARHGVDMILVTDGIHLVFKNPKEYDCVLQFDGPFIRDSFVNMLREKLGGIVVIQEQQGTLKQSLSAAMTKNDRLKRLEKFFRVVFAQAFNIDKPSGSKDLLDPKLIREVIQTELTRAEFGDALGMKSGSQFVEKMFDLVDRDQNGYISFREFLDMLVIFAKGSAEDKAQLMFEMYDINGDGVLSVDEFKNMIRSMIEAANADVNNEDVNDLVKSMLDSAGLKRESQVSLQDFQKLLSRHKDRLGYAHLNFQGPNVPMNTRKGNEAQSLHQSARAAVISIYGGQEDEMEKAQDKLQEEQDSTVLPTTQKKNRLETWAELYRPQIFWTILFTLVVFAIFAERAYSYTVEREHRGLRHIAGYGVTITRGAASVMMFCYAALLLTMCRNTITHLRETFLHRFIPFDKCVLMHRYIAIVALIFTIVHVLGHAINFYHISTQTSSDLICLFREYYRASHVIPKFHYWCFQTVTGLTGILLVIQAALIYTFSTNYARSYAFQMFWVTHKTYPLWYVLMIIHGSGNLVQEPIFQNFLLGPLVLFILDRLVTTSRKKIEIPVLRAELLPSNVTKLEFVRPTGFEYKSGQWVRIACLAFNSNEYHPFTLSSAPHESILSLHIRAVGPFTANIRQIYERGLPKLYLDGPYGEGHQDWWRYEVAVLVGGGIGVTPFASILKDVAANSNPRNCKRIYFIWVTRTQKQFEWLVDIIREVEEHKIIKIHVFVTEVFDKFDLRTVLLYICERHFQKVSNRSLFTGLRSITHFGRPNFHSFFRSLRTIHPNVSKFGIFSCGPLPMTKNVDEACTESNNDVEGRGAIFQHHFENF